MILAWKSRNSGYGLVRRNTDGAWETIDREIMFGGLNITIDNLNRLHYVISDDSSDTGPDDPHKETHC